MWRSTHGAERLPPWRRRGAALATIVVVVLASWWPRLSGPIDLRWDGAGYYMLGTSLASGQGYRLLSEPGSPPSTLHPPVLPLIVAAAQLALGTDDPAVVGVALRWTMLLVCLALALATYALFRRTLSRPLALAGTLIGVVHPQFIYFSDLFYAEPLFTLCTVLVLLCHDRPGPAGRSGTVASAWLAYATRTAGIALLAAWVGDRWRRKGARAGVATLVLALVPVLAWTAWIRVAESSPERREPSYAYQTAPYVYFNVSYVRNLLVYDDPFRPEAGPLTPRGFADRVARNLAAMPEGIGRTVGGWDAPRTVAWLLSALVALGIVGFVRRREWLLVGFLALSLLVMCTTPFARQFPRYLQPLYPVLALAALQALAAFQRSAWTPLAVLSRRWRTVLVWGCVALAAGSVLRGTARLFSLHEDVAYEGRDGRPVRYRMFFYEPYGPPYDAAIDWLLHHAASSDVVAAPDPHWVHMRTGRRAVLAPFELDGRVAQGLVDSVPVRFLVVENDEHARTLGGSYRYTAALLAANPGLWRRVWQSDDGRVAIHARR